MQELPWLSTQDSGLSKGLTIWRQILNVFKAQPYLNGNILTGIDLKIGANVIYHNLGQPQTGWVLTDITGIATIYRSAQFNSKTLTLTSSAAVTINLWVF